MEHKKGQVRRRERLPSQHSQPGSFCNSGTSLLYLVKRLKTATVAGQELSARGRNRTPEQVTPHIPRWRPHHGPSSRRSDLTGSGRETPVHPPPVHQNRDTSANIVSRPESHDR